MASWTKSSKAVARLWKRWRNSHPQSKPMLFTFVTDYLGGTYIDQVSADDLPTAVSLWQIRLASNPELSITSWTSTPAADRPLSVDGMLGCWCVTGMDQENRLILAHVISTAA